MSAAAAPAGSSPYVVSFADVVEAAARIAPFVLRTPVHTCEAVDALFAPAPSGSASASASACAAASTAAPQRRAFFKCELFQRSGSFKARGAINAVVLLGPDARQRGVTTHSSGNHAAALAFAARRLGLPAVIVMPENAPAIKRRAVERLGARVVLCEPTQAAREAAAQRVVDESGAAFVHPSEDPRVIAGQGTIALELLPQVRDLLVAEGGALEDSNGPVLDAVIVPVGGGGMVSGIAVAIKGLDPRIRIIAAEPLAASDAFRSKRSGTLEGHASGLAPQTIADGLKTTLGKNTFPIVRDLVDEVVCVSEAEIAAALRLVYEQLKLAIEPSAAVGAAALLCAELSCERRPELRRVGVVLCGGNVDIDLLPALLATK